VQPLLRFYFWLTAALAAVAGAIMVAIFIGVILDVLIRDFGYQSPRQIEPLAEYGLLYITMLGSPWLLRTKGMIIVESFRMALPMGARRALELVAYVACSLICFVLTWYSAYQTIFSWVNGQADQRAITIPLYYGYAPMLLGFFLMGCEFLRRLFGKESLYDQSATEQETM
jgi:C4-dicarboxylate transporter DctQ subunit